ncbi:hypothetical protein AB0M47_21015 [Hamadaea sp. NPDC051192]
MRDLDPQPEPSEMIVALYALATLVQALAALFNAMNGCGPA